MNPPNVQFEGEHLRLVSRDGWEFAQRREVSGVVGVLAVTGEGKLVLVEQFRIPVNASVIELPAGLAGDLANAREEDLSAAAGRELLEETGYAAERFVELARGPSSAGLTDETIVLFKAENLRRVTAGGGDASERILVHEVPLAEVPAWCRARLAEGKLIDFKVWAALVFAGG